MRSDIILGIITFAMAALGGIVSVSPPLKTWQKSSYVFLFLLLGGFGLFFVVRQSNETAVAGAKLSNALDGIRTSTAENTKISELNTELQQQLLGQSGVISDLARKGIDTATGGDSFCLMNFWDTNTQLTLNSGVPFFEAQGTYPLYEVRASIVDQNYLSKLTPIQQLSFDNWRRSVYVGNIGARQLESVNLRIPFTDPPKKQSFLVQFSARNGNWTEIIRLYRADKIWVKAFKVTKDNKERTVLYECVPKAFPIAELDWTPTKNACAGK